MNKGQATPWLRRVYPAQLYDDDSLVAVDAHYVPLIIADMEARKTPKLWASDAEWAIGYQALCQQGVNLLMPATTAIVDSIDRVYRLLDTALNGVAYTASIAPSTGEIAYDPPMPITPNPALPTTPFALRAQIGRLRQLAENAATGQEFAAGSAMNGTVALDFDGSWRARLEALQGTTGGFFGIGGERVTLADLLQAGRINTAADQGLIADSFEEILTAVSQGANIGGVLTNILSAGADAATDGGVIAATLAASLAQAATSATLSSQLDRLIKSIDGGGLLGPGDNLLQAIRGDIEAGPDRSLMARLDSVFLPDAPQPGDDYPWPGIKNWYYDIWSILNYSLREDVAPSAVTTARMLQYLGYHLGATTTQGALAPGGGSTPLPLFLLSRNVRDALTVESGDSVLTRLGNIRTSLSNLVAAVGTLESSPATETVKTLLAALVECCEGGGTDPGGTENPAPAGFCSGFTRVRQLNWEQLGATTIGGTAATVYRVQFNFSEAALAPAQGYIPVDDPNAPQSIRIVDGVAVNLCLSWDFTGQTAPLAFGRDIGAVGSTLVNSQFTGTPLTTQELQTGGDSVNVDRVTNDGDRLVIYNFAFATGVTPTLNVHLGVEDVTPS